MKKIIILLIFLLSIPTTFATLTTKEKLTIQSIFSKYEVNVSKFSKNEQIEKVEKLIQTIDSLLNTSKAENNNLFCDVLLELKNLLRFKHNALTSDITTQYVESPGMKAIVCEQLGICENQITKNQGNLEISLSFASPKSQVIPSNGLITFGKLDFTANGKDINIYSITLTRTGLGYARNIKRLYFEKDGVKISNIGSVSSDNTAIITFFPTLVINQGSTFTLDLVGELDVNSGGGEYGFSVKSASDVESDVNVIGIFPVTTYLMGVGTYSTGKIDVTNNNISINYSPGIKSATIGSFNLSASGNSDNLVFKSIKLRNTGTANIDLLWSIRLYRDNKEVSYTTSINGRDLIIHLYDTIKNNGTANYKLKADMIYCKGYDEYEYYDDEKKYKCEYELKESYKFEIRNSYDIVIIEELSGFSPTININQ